MDFTDEELDALRELITSIVEMKDELAALALLEGIGRRIAGRPRGAVN